MFPVVLSDRGVSGRAKAARSFKVLTSVTDKTGSAPSPLDEGFEDGGATSSSSSPLMCDPLLLLDTNGPEAGSTDFVDPDVEFGIAQVSRIGEVISMSKFNSLSRVKVNSLLKSIPLLLLPLLPIGLMGALLLDIVAIGGGMNPKNDSLSDNDSKTIAGVVLIISLSFISSDFVVV